MGGPEGLTLCFGCCVGPGWQWVGQWHLSCRDLQAAHSSSPPQADVQSASWVQWQLHSTKPGQADPMPECTGDSEMNWSLETKSLGYDLGCLTATELSHAKGDMHP